MKTVPANRMWEENVLRVTSAPGSRVPECPLGKPTKAAPHWRDGKVGKCPVPWKNWVAAKSHSITGTQGTLKPPGGKEGNTLKSDTLHCSEQGCSFLLLEIYCPTNLGTALI